MNGTRQQIQYSLALEQADQGEAPVTGHQRTEPFVAKPAPESSAVTEQLMEEVCDRENLVTAWKRVRQNKGGPGVDGMTIDDAKDYLREHWPSIRSQLLAGTYQPQPVKRVEIPKPDGGVRKLGVPCVVDRLIQQALLQVLQGQWDPTFSEHSYGDRLLGLLGRSAELDAAAGIRRPIHSCHLVPERIELGRQSAQLGPVRRILFLGRRRRCAIAVRLPELYIQGHPRGHRVSFDGGHGHAIGDLRGKRQSPAFLPRIDSDCRQVVATDRRRNRHYRRIAAPRLEYGDREYLR